METVVQWGIYIGFYWKLLVTVTMNDKYERVHI